MMEIALSGYEALHLSSLVVGCDGLDKARL